MDPPPSHPKHTQLDLDQGIHDNDDDEEYQQQQQQQQLVLYKAREMVDATAQDTDNDNKNESAAAAAPSFFRRFLGPSPNAVLSSSFYPRPEPLALPRRQDNDGLLVLPQPPRVENQSSEQEEQQDDDPLAAPLLVPPPSHLSSSSSWGRSPLRSVKRVLVSSCAVVVMGVMARWAVLHHGHSHAPPPPAPVDRYVVLKTCLEDDLHIVPSKGITAWFWNGLH